MKDILKHVSERGFTEDPYVVSQRDPDEFLAVAVHRKALAWLPGSGDTENDWKIRIYSEVFLEHERNFRDCGTEGLVYGKSIDFDDGVWWRGS